ncbi:hypothetical protein BDD12DRAFT_832783 [Trichophaea hybrida]|nr:hypothetical protein BDD12DRAFT_832783 [Trichophaea hybrida]
MASKSVFRVIGLPEDATVADFKELEQFLKKGEQLRLVDEAIVPSCPVRSTLSGIFGVLHPLPEFLERMRNGTTTVVCFHLRGEDVAVDQNFYGFTQMYPTSPGTPIVADIVALAGLNSHAYDSWTADSNLERMWLREFFSTDFPDCRTMIYGYNSNLKSRSIHNTLYHCQRFLKDLQDLRESEQESKRPLIFIGHGYGGIIVAHTLVQARFGSLGNDNSLDCLLKATCGILFFGVPHRGMLVKSVVDALMRGGHTGQLELLKEIDQGSKTLEIELRRFIDLCPLFKIYTFHQMLETRSVVVQTDGAWSQAGVYEMAVQDKSAILQLPESLEVKIQVESNHSDLVRFATPSQRAYQDVYGCIKRLLSEPPTVIATRLSM